MDSSSVNGMCRCCASEGAFKDIKTSYHWMGEEEVYGDMLRECFDVNLSSAEHGGICEVCITQLRNAANFKKQVLHTESQFKQHLRSKGFKAAQVKEEMSGFDDNDSDDMDNVDDEDYVPDYEVPIKTESESEEKPKKRAAKPATTRSKKSKSNDGEAAVKNTRRSSSEESDTPLIFVEENRITLDRKVNFTSFISILPADARKKTPANAFVEEKPKKVEKRKENIIDEIFEPMDHEPLEPLPLDPIPKRVETTTKRKTAPRPPRPKRKAPRQRELTEEKVRKRPVTEIEWHLENIKVILSSSNATPIRSRVDGEYQCSYCKLQFEKLTDLKVHTLTSKSHKKKKPDFLKIHYASLSKHIVYLDITALQCAICHLEMISLEALMEHLKNDHDENMHLVIKNQIMPLRVVDEKLTCSVCAAELEFELIQEHMAQHYRNYVCEFCDTSFVIRSKMIDHKKAVHDL